MIENKLLFRDLWDNTSKDMSLDQPMDAIICPVAPSQSIPHGFPIWWGYTSLWNYLDYPSTVVPCKRMALHREKDKKSSSYIPVPDVADFDRLNWEICKSRCPLKQNSRTALRDICRRRRRVFKLPNFDTDRGTTFPR